MQNFLREHSWPVAVSVLLHGLLVGVLLLLTYVSSQQRLPSIQPIAIDAVVVDSQVLHAAQQAQVERAAEALARVRAAEEAKAAAAAQADADARAAEQARTTAATQAQTEAAQRAAAEAAAAAQAETERQAKAATAAAAEQQRAEQAQHRASADKAMAEARAALEARRAADERKALAAKQAAEAKQSAEAKAAADAKSAADVKRAADDHAKQDREAELRRQLADEEHVSAVQSGPLRDRYITLLRNKIQNAWIKPPSATPGIDCLVQVTQVPGGEVTGARVTQCNGDAAVRQSIENAVYRASPLPDPPDPALFERNLSLRFRPNE